jgi:hypothetical protein
LRNPRAA